MLKLVKITDDLSCYDVHGVRHAEGNMWHNNKRCQAILPDNPIYLDPGIHEVEGCVVCGFSSAHHCRSPSRSLTAQLGTIQPPQSGW